jgi:hypothetical protein
MKRNPKPKIKKKENTKIQKPVLTHIPLVSWNAFDILREIKKRISMSACFLLINEIQIRRKTITRRKKDG